MTTVGIRRGRTLITGLLVIAAAFSACQNGEDRSASSQLPPESTVRVAVASDPQTLDPRQARDSTSQTLLRMLFEGLTRRNAEGHTQPALAEAIQISRDLTTYTFNLREAYWSDGTPVTAHDFKYAWTKVLSPDFPAPNAYMLYSIRGAKAAKEGRAPVEQVGVKALDDKTLVVELTEPTPTFLELTTLPVYFPVSQKWEQLHPEWCDKVSTLFVGNGAYSVDHWFPKDELLLVRNPLYWEAQKVTMENILLTVQDDSTALMMFERGELDWVGSPLGTLPPDCIPEVKADGRLQIADAAATEFLRFNTASGPLANREFRQALSYALDRGAIADHILQAGQEPATGLVPRSMGLRDRPYFRDRNIVAARRLFSDALEEMGLSRQQLPRITLKYPNSLERRHKIAQALQQQWKHAFGVDVALQAMESKVLNEQLRAGDYDIHLYSWFADFDDASNFLEVFKERNNGTNNTGWEDPRYVQLLDTAREVSSSERIELLRKAEALLIEEMPIAPLFHYTLNYLKRPDLQGAFVGDIGTVDFRNARYEQRNVAEAVDE